MKIKIDFKTNADESFFIKLNNDTKEVFVNSTVVFDVDKPGEYELHIFQEKSRDELTFVSVLLFALTAVLWGIIRLIAARLTGGPDVEDDWRSSVCPWCVDYKAKLNIIKNSYFEVRYDKSVFYKDINTWSKPVIFVDGDDDTVSSDNTEYIPNCIDIKNKAYARIKKIVSILPVCLLVFSPILYGYIKMGDVPMIILVSSLLALGTLVVIFNLIYIIKKAKSLISTLESEIKATEGKVIL